MICVGILHSLSGAMAISEASLVDAALMAIDEINEAGGVLGQQITPLIEDGASNPEIFTEKARQLVERGAVTLFGCWTSASRKAVLPVIEAANVLLWYPVQYEGLEQSPNIFYTSICPNQQIEPAVHWLLRQGRRRFYLIGSDYVFPWTVNKLITAQLKATDGEIVGERYVDLDESDLTGIIQDIRQAQPDVVVSTLNGRINLDFYPQYAAAGLSADAIPIMAMSVSESELASIGSVAAGHFASWGYFQSLEFPENQRFVEQFQRRYGRDRVTSDPIEAAYAQVYLWAQSVEAAQSFASDRVRQSAYGQRFEAPGGPITIESNHHVSKPCRIGQIQTNGQFQVVMDTEAPIHPLPWLGVEQASFRNVAVVIDLLSEVSQWIQKAQQLEHALARLTQEMRDRQSAEDALRESQTQLTRTQTELELTHRLQKSLLPPSQELAMIPGLAIAGLMEPAQSVGGDYYDVLVREDHVYIAVGDVTGHGLRSSMITLMVQAAIRTLIENGETSVARMLNAANRVVYENTHRMRSHRNMSLSILDYHDGGLQIWGQHETVIVVRHGGEIEVIDTIDLGFPLGIEPDIAPFIHSTQLEFRPEDMLVLYSDGVVESMNQTNDQYGLDRLYQILQSNAYASSEYVCTAVLEDVRRHRGNQSQFDDITLLVLKRL